MGSHHHGSLLLLRIPQYISIECDLPCMRCNHGPPKNHQHVMHVKTLGSVLCCTIELCPRTVAGPLLSLLQAVDFARGVFHPSFVHQLTYTGRYRLHPLINLRWIVSSSSPFYDNLRRSCSRSAIAQGPMGLLDLQSLSYRRTGKPSQPSSKGQTKLLVYYLPGLRDSSPTKIHG